MSLSVSCHVDQSSYFYWFKMCWSSPWLRILCWGTVYICILPLQLVFSINVSLSFQKANTTLKSIPFCLISHFSQSLMQPITWNIYRQPKKRINHGIWFNEPCCLFFTLREQKKKKTMKMHQHTASSNMVRNCSCPPQNVVWLIRSQCILGVFTPGFSRGRVLFDCDLISLHTLMPGVNGAFEARVVVSEYNIWSLIWRLCWDSTIITQYKWNISLSYDPLSHTV